MPSWTIAVYLCLIGTKMDVLSSCLRSSNASEMEYENSDRRQLSLNYCYWSYDSDENI